MAKEVLIAKPGNERAYGALIKHKNSPVKTGGSVVFIAIVGGWTAVAGQHNHALAVFLLAILCVIALVSGTATVRQLLGRDSYGKMLSQGQIMALDPVVIEAFDQLCREQRLVLTDDERQEALAGLWEAAQDVTEAVREYNSLDPEQPNLEDKRLLELAKIRARVNQEVQVLIEDNRSEAVQQGLSEDDSGAYVPGISGADVTAQLELMRKTSKQPRSLRPHASFAREGTPRGSFRFANY